MKKSALNSFNGISEQLRIPKNKTIFYKTAGGPMNQCVSLKFWGNTADETNDFEWGDWVPDRTKNESLFERNTTFYYRTRRVQVNSAFYRRPRTTVTYYYSVYEFIINMYNTRVWCTREDRSFIIDEPQPTHITRWYVQVRIVHTCARVSEKKEKHQQRRRRQRRNRLHDYNSIYHSCIIIAVLPCGQLISRPGEGDATRMTHARRGRHTGSRSVANTTFITLLLFLSLSCLEDFSRHTYIRTAAVNNRLYARARQME